MHSVAQPEYPFPASPGCVPHIIDRKGDSGEFQPEKTIFYEPQSDLGMHILPNEPLVGGIQLRGNQVEYFLYVQFVTGFILRNISLIKLQNILALPRSPENITSLWHLYKIHLHETLEASPELPDGIVFPIWRAPVIRSAFEVSL